MLAVDLNAGPMATAFRDNTIGAFYEIAKRAPGEPVALQLGRERMLVLQDAGQIRQVLRESTGKYRKNFGGFQGLFGESRFTTDGSKWEFLQTLSQPHISAARPAEVTTAATEAFKAAAQQMLSGVDDGGAVVIDGAINRAAAQVIADVAFGAHGIELETVLEDFRAILRYGASRNWTFGTAATPASDAARQGYESARVRMQAVISMALEQTGGSALMDDISNAEGDVDPVAEIAGLLFAGFDTTASAVGWGMFLLAADPDLQIRLRARLIEGLEGDEPTLDRLERIPELQAFQNEVLRIFPPVPLLGRIANEADQLGDIGVTAGQRVILSVIGMHHDRRHVPAPAEVRLDRQSALPEGHMAFGAGRRGCAGSRIARVELATAFAVLIPALKVSLLDHERLHFDYVASLRRLGGHRLRVAAIR